MFDAPEKYFLENSLLPLFKNLSSANRRAISGNKEAYQFLSASIMSFQSPEQTALMMKEAGFENVATHYFSMGMATLIVGKK